MFHLLNVEHFISQPFYQQQQQLEMASLSITTSSLVQNSTNFNLQSCKSHKNPTFLSFKEPRADLKKWVFFNKAKQASFRPLETKATGSPGLYSAETFELNAKNVDFVLEDVRPYLISDGGNVDVVSVEDGIISLKLQGACGSCPSSTTTMKMGIERVLKEKFGDAVKDIRQVFDEQQNELNVEAVNRHLDILRPAIQNYGGSVEVLSIDGGDCHVKYEGPDSIGSGIKAAIKEKFPDIVNVVLSS